MQIFSEALNFKNLDWGILINRGDCYNTLKDYEKAIKVKSNYFLSLILNFNINKIQIILIFITSNLSFISVKYF